MQKALGLKHATRLIAGAVVAGLLESTAEAALVTVQVDGIVDSVEANDGLLPFADVRVGQSFSIRYAIETTTPDADLPDPTHGNYLGGIPTMTVSISGQAFTIPLLGPPVFVDGYLSARNDSPVGSPVRDNLTYFRSGCTTATGPCYAGTVLMNSQGVAPVSILGSDVLVPVPTMFPLFVTQQLSFRVNNFSTAGSDQVSGYITGVNEVPLPASLWLLLSGIPAIAIFRHLRSAS